MSVTVSEPWADDETRTDLTPEPVVETKTDFTPAPVVADEFNEGALNLKKIYEEVNSLFREPEDDDDPRISGDTVGTTIELLERVAYRLQRLPMPAAAATTDSSGGIRIEWWRGDHCVILAVKSNKDQYVFCKLPDDGRGVIRRPVYPEQLASYLESLAQLADVPNE